MQCKAAKWNLSLLPEHGSDTSPSVPFKTNNTERKGEICMSLRMFRKTVQFWDSPRAFLFQFGKGIGRAAEAGGAALSRNGHS